MIVVKELESDGVLDCTQLNATVWTLHAPQGGGELLGSNDGTTWVSIANIDGNDSLVLQFTWRYLTWSGGGNLFISGA